MGINIGLSSIRSLIHQGSVAHEAEASVKQLAKAPALSDQSTISASARQALQERDPGIQHKTFSVASDRDGIFGGSKPKQIMFDAEGNRWLFKAAPGGKDYRAVVEENASELFNAMGIQTPRVYTTIQQMDGKGKLGTIQQMVSHSGSTLPHDVTLLTKEQQDQILRSHSGRWLISDHDGKLENYLVHRDGRLEDIDLGQAFRFFPEDRLDRHYNPNGEPTYANTMFKGYVKGKIDLDFEQGLAAAAQLQAFPDSRVREILAPYAKAFADGKGAERGQSAEDFMKKVLERKHHIKEDMAQFYESLKAERAARAQADH